MRRPALFHGWIVVRAAFLALGTVFGVACSFATFFGAFAAEFTSQRADVSMVFGLSGLLCFALGAASAVFDATGSYVPVMATCALCAAGATLASSRVRAEASPPSHHR